MKKSRLGFLLVSVLLLTPIVAGTLSRAATEDAGGADSLSKNLSVFSEVLSLIRRAYVDETSMEELLAGALDGSTDALDPLATFVPAGSVDRYREVLKVGRQHSGLIVGKDRGFSFVLTVDPGSPGAAAGLEQGDILAKIDDLSTRRLPLWKLQSLLAAEPGTEMLLEVMRRGQTHDLTLTLGTYEPQPPSLEYVDDQAVLHLRRFDEQDLGLLRGVLADLADQNRGSLLIDIRGNAGGDFAAAYSIAGLFVDGGLGRLQSEDEAMLQFKGQGKPVWQGETVLLIDNGTQGAAEVFATVMHQLAESQLVGRGTFGHAGRQRLIPLSDGSEVLLSDAFYSGPDGEPIDHPLIPDVTVVDFGGATADDEESREDEVLQKGLELLSDGEDEDVRDVA